MKRSFARFSHPNIEQLKLQLLHWSKQYSTTVVMDSNDYAHQEKKYDFIFDRSSEGTMLYSAKNYDISDLVIKRLNRNKKIQERKEKIEDLKSKAKN